MSNTRLEFIDLGKALTIIYVMLLHTGFPFVGNTFIFAMPLFFFCSGYLFTPGRCTLKQNAQAQFKKLLLPFWGLYIVYGVVELIRAPYVGYGEPDILRPALNALYGSCVVPNPNGVFDALKMIRAYNATSAPSVVLISPTDCHLWFLPAFFTASVIFSFVATRVERLSYKIIAIILLVFLGSLESVVPEIYQLPYAVGRGFIGAAFMLAGLEMCRGGIFESAKKALPVCVIGLCAAVTATLLGSNGGLYIVSYYGEYGILSTYLTFVGGLGGLVCVLYICKLLADVVPEGAKSLFLTIGRSTMSLYAWHFLVFFILDVLYVNVFSASFEPDKYYMALLPVESAWWYMILKVVATIAICLGVARFRNKQQYVKL